MNSGDGDAAVHISREDCHFYHKNLLTEMDNRGFESVEHMNEYMIEKWNKKVHLHVLVQKDRWFFNYAEMKNLNMQRPQKVR